MSKKLLILGDSFCHGIGTHSVFKHVENTRYAFGNYLAKHLKLEYVNLAEPGSSILRSIELGRKYISENKDDIERVVIGWTDPQRICHYGDESSLLILPQFVHLGNIEDDDVFVKEERHVKFITDGNNQEFLDTLPNIQKIMILNGFFDHQQSISESLIICFTAWLDSMNVEYLDIDNFGRLREHKTKLDVQFKDVMPTLDRHPTKQEQERLAELIKEEL
jgi:hypothetical protein